MKSLIADLFSIIGITAIVYGASLIHPAAALLLGGSFCLVIGQGFLKVINRKSKAKDKTK